MNRYRWVGGLAVLASLALGATACQSDKSPGTGGSPSASNTSAIEQLQAAAVKTQGQSFKFTLTWGTMLNGEGAIDSGAKNNDVKVTVADPTSGLRVQAAMRSLGTDAYLQLDLGALGSMVPGLSDVAGKWMRIDATKLPEDLTFGIKPGSSGILGVDTWVSGVISAEKTGDKEIKGKIDLAKSTFSISKDDIAKLPADQREVPFTATLDDQGRIAKIQVTMPKVSTFPASDLTTTYSDWGSAVTVTKPAADQTVEAPSILYQLFASL